MRAMPTVLVVIGWLVCGAGSAMAIQSLVGFGGVGPAWRTAPGHWLLGIGLLGGVVQLVLGLSAVRRAPSPWLAAAPLAAALYAGWQALTRWYAVVLPLPGLSTFPALAVLEPPALPRIMLVALIEAFDLATLGALVATGLCAQAALAALAASVAARAAHPSHEQGLTLARSRSVLAAGALGALALALAAFWCQAQAAVYFALGFVEARSVPAFAELRHALQRQTVASLLQLLLVPALVGAWWLLRRQPRLERRETPPLRWLLAAVPLTFWGGAGGGRLRAAAELKKLDQRIAPLELTPALVPGAVQGTHGGNRPLFVTSQGVYARHKGHIVRLADARRLDGSDCLQVLSQMHVNPDSRSGARLELWPTSVLLDQAADTHVLVCTLLYVSLSPRQNERDFIKPGYGLAPGAFIDPMSQRFLVRSVTHDLPEEYAVFRHDFCEVPLTPTFLGTERYSRRHPPHVHLAASSWRFRVDEAREHPAQVGSVVGSTDERLARLKEKLGTIYSLHVSAESAVPAAQVLRIAATFRDVALYVGADVAAQLEPATERAQLR
jgi:hypothetical protein